MIISFDPENGRVVLECAKHGPLGYIEIGQMELAAIRSMLILKTAEAWNYTPVAIPGRCAQCEADALVLTDPREEET